MTLKVQLRTVPEKSLEYFSEDFIEELCEFLSECEGVEVISTHRVSYFSEDLEFFDNEDMTHILLRVFNNSRLIVKIVNLRNQRNGVFTELVKKLCAELSTANLDTFMVESVITHPMQAWCCKYGLYHALGSCGTDDGLGVDYVCPFDHLYDL